MTDGPNGLPLFVLRCESCEGEWPCDRFAWAKMGDVESVTAKCLVRGCGGEVFWTGEEWTRASVAPD